MLHRVQLVELLGTMLQGCDVLLCEQRMILWLQNVAETSPHVMTPPVREALHVAKNMPTSTGISDMTF